MLTPRYSTLPPHDVLPSFAAALAYAPAPARAADDDKDWKVLGETKIKDAKDAASGAGKDRKRGDDKKDDKKKAEAGTAAGEIDVSAAEGLVKRIKFEVRGAEVEFKKITVTYESGDPEEIEVRDEKVRNRGRTRTIDLKAATARSRRCCSATRRRKPTTPRKATSTPASF
jgi:hypothetical protein